MNKGNNVLDELGDQYTNQISVLKVLSGQRNSLGQPRPVEIAELVELCGFEDEREIQRSLYILEGHKYVAPHPAGDFTSKIWHITDDGLKAFMSLDE